MRWLSHPCPYSSLVVAILCLFGLILEIRFVSCNYNRWAISGIILPREQDWLKVVASSSLNDRALITEQYFEQRYYWKFEHT